MHLLGKGQFLVAIYIFFFIWQMLQMNYNYIFSVSMYWQNICRCEAMLHQLQMNKFAWTDF